MAEKEQYFSLFSGEPSIPNASELLSLKILKDANPQAFDGLAREETKWLSVALGLLRRDKYLELSMGGRGIRPAMKLAGVLKQKAEQKHFDKRLDSTVEAMVKGKFNQTGWSELSPVNAKDKFLSLADDGKGIVIENVLEAPAVAFGKDNNSSGDF